MTTQEVFFDVSLIQMSANENNLICTYLFRLPGCTWSPIKRHVNTLKNEAPGLIINIQNSFATIEIFPICLHKAINPLVEKLPINGADCVETNG